MKSHTLKVEAEAIFDNPFEDQVFVCPIVSPVITPHGHTYEYAEISNWLSIQQTDPFTRGVLNESQLIPNHVFSTLKKLLTDEVLDEKKLRAVLLCPLSLLPFHIPVVAQDGHTYELDFIQAYTENYGKTPTGLKQILPFYPNLFIKDVMQGLGDIFDVGVSLPQDLMNPLHDYMKKRAEESHFAGSIFGWGKWHKLKACATLVNALSGRISIFTFFSSSHDKTREILGQGRLESISAPAIEFLQST